MKSRPQVFITQPIPDSALILLRRADINVRMNRDPELISRSDLIRYAKNADGIISLLSTQFDKDVIYALNRCKIIANYAVGYNNIDINTAREKNIIITNTPDVLTDATAELTIALILAVARQIPRGDRFMREWQFKGWRSDLFLGMQLSEAVAGIIGAGRIGQAVANRMSAFGAKIVYYSLGKNLSLEKETGAIFLPLETLLKTSDIISIHTPLTEQTRNLLNADKLSLLKPTSILINTSRGEVLDEQFLIKLLKKRKIFGAGLDVYHNEPNVNPELLKLENIVLSPHTGSATYHARNRMAEIAAKNIINVLAGKKPITPVG